VREYRFIVDHNVGKLAKWLRMMGYDSLFFKGSDDSDMVKHALSEGRIILTRDTEIMKRRVVTNGQLRVVLIESEESELQMQQIIETLHLDCGFRPFTLCLECNKPLIERNPEEVRERIPPYVYKTQQQYMECPSCRRIYWRGTHWKAMMKMLQRLGEDCSKSLPTQE
jgi:uncharacterized protein with PIN domain